MNEGHYAVVVGINQYAGFTALQRAVRDAVEVGKWLAGDGGVPHIHRVIQDAADPRRPIMQEVFGAVLEWRMHVNAQIDAGKLRWTDTRLYVYVSGHGYAANGSDAALLTADASQHALYGVSLAKLRDFLEESQEFREIVVFADCCREQIPGAQELSRPPWPSELSPGREGGTRCILWLATPFGARAYEPPGKHDNGQAEHGYFTQALLDGLRGGAAKGGVIDSTELSAFIERRVAELLPPGRRQSPVVSPPSATSPFIFWRDGAAPPNPPPVKAWRVDIRAGENTVLTVRDGNGKAHGFGLAKLVVDVPAGLYTVQFQDVFATTMQNIDVDRDLTIDAARPTSIASVNGSAGSNESHQEAAHELAQPINFADRPALAVIVRYRRDEQRGAQVSLQDVHVPLPDGRFSGVYFAATEQRSGDGRFHGMSWFLPSGPIEVQFPGRLTLPLWILEDWITYVFAPPGADGRAALQGASIHLRPKDQGITPHIEGADDNALAEYALLSLLRGVPAITDNDLRQLLHAKWQNPMAGILGAHVLLLADHVEIAVMQEVLGNLARLVPGHPELLGLRAAYLRHRVLRGEDPAAYTVERPSTFDLPTTWHSWEAMLWLDHRFGGIIPADCPMARAASRVTRAGVWLALQPPATRVPRGEDELSARVEKWVEAAGVDDPVHVARGTGLPVSVARRLLR